VISNVFVTEKIMVLFAMHEELWNVERMFEDKLYFPI
jgi:hypothetical protein